jgi:hypothetical protein
MSSTGVTVQGWITAADAERGMAVLLPYSGDLVLQVSEAETDADGQVLLSGGVISLGDPAFLKAVTRRPFRPSAPLYRRA